MRVDDVAGNISQALFDGGFDQLIGQVSLKCADLEIHEGLSKPPAAKWLTMLDAEGKDKNSEGKAQYHHLTVLLLMVYSYALSTSSS
jgi:hypothetical protein